MNAMKKLLWIVTIIIIPFFTNGCDQYEYYSPMPGTILIKFKSEYIRFDTLFSENNFTLKISEIAAIRSDDAHAYIYSSPKAIWTYRSAIYNMLGQNAYYGTEVIGEYPIPPGKYKGIKLLVEPSMRVVLDGYRIISVVRPSDYSATVNLSVDFEIQENRTTEVIIKVDLDRLLEPRAYDFLYNSAYYEVLSIKTY